MCSWSTSLTLGYPSSMNDDSKLPPVLLRSAADDLNDVRRDKRCPVTAELSTITQTHGRPASRHLVQGAPLDIP